MHSPLLGPTSWQAVAAELGARGHDCIAPAWPRLADVEGDVYRGLATGMASTLGDAPSVAVAHSGAGALMPSLASATDAIEAVILVDAILPHPGRSWFDTAPPELAASLRAGADFGMLPSWDRWWPPGALERLVPDNTMRAALLDELEPLPLAYFETSAPAASITIPAAYLQLSGAYETESRVAGRLGWPLVRLSLHHLAILTHAAAVATAIEGLALRLAPARG